MSDEGTAIGFWRRAMEQAFFGALEQAERKRGLAESTDHGKEIELWQMQLLDALLDYRHGRHAVASARLESVVVSPEGEAYLAELEERIDRSRLDEKSRSALRGAIQRARATTGEGRKRAGRRRMMRALIALAVVVVGGGTAAWLRLHQVGRSDSLARARTGLLVARVRLGAHGNGPERIASIAAASAFVVSSSGYVITSRLAFDQVMDQYSTGTRTDDFQWDESGKVPEAPDTVQGQPEWWITFGGDRWSRIEARFYPAKTRDVVVLKIKGAAGKLPAPLETSREYAKDEQISVWGFPAVRFRGTAPDLKVNRRLTTAKNKDMAWCVAVTEIREAERAVSERHAEHTTERVLSDSFPEARTGASSALGRIVSLESRELSDEQRQAYGDMILTDALKAECSQGGPVLDERGRLIGMLSWTRPPDLSARLWAFSAFEMQGDVQIGMEKEDGGFLWPAAR